MSLHPALQGLEGREPIALVVDDTSSVWGNHEENLVAVERYIYFPASRRQFGSKSKALLELRRDETPQSGMLMTALNVLLRTHRRTFRVLQESGGLESTTYRSGERPSWDVRQVLQQERKQASSTVSPPTPMHAATRLTAGKKGLIMQECCMCHHNQNVLSFAASYECLSVTALECTVFCTGRQSCCWSSPQSHPDWYW